MQRRATNKPDPAAARARQEADKAQPLVKEAEKDALAAQEAQSAVQSPAEEEVVSSAKTNRRIPSVPLRQFKLREAVNACWRVRLPAGVTPADAEDVEFMADLLSVNSPNFTAFDPVMVTADDGGWFAELVVAESGPGLVQLVHLRTVNMPDLRGATGSRLPPDHEIIRDRHSGFYEARRISDGVTMVRYARSHEDAVRALLDHASLRNTAHGHISSASII